MTKQFRKDAMEFVREYNSEQPNLEAMISPLKAQLLLGKYEKELSEAVEHLKYLKSIIEPMPEIYYEIEMEKVEKFLSSIDCDDDYDDAPRQEDFTGRNGDG